MPTHRTSRGPAARTRGTSTRGSKTHKMKNSKSACRCTRTSVCKSCAATYNRGAGRKSVVREGSRAAGAKRRSGTKRSHGGARRGRHMRGGLSPGDVASAVYNAGKTAVSSVYHALTGWMSPHRAAAAGDEGARAPKIDDVDDGAVPYDSEASDALGIPSFSEQVPGEKLVLAVRRLFPKRRTQRTTTKQQIINELDKYGKGSQIYMWRRMPEKALHELFVDSEILNDDEFKRALAFSKTNEAARLMSDAEQRFLKRPYV